MSDTANVSSALVAYLKTTPVNDLVDGRIVRPEVPLDDIAAGLMPRALVVVRHAGGGALFGDANIPAADPTIDMFCYGSTWLEAETIADEIAPALRVIRSTVIDGVRLYWARLTTLPNPFADTETDWPCSVVSAQVAHCQLALT